MKTIRANLLADVVSVYDQNKTTISGRINQKVISGVDVLGPSINITLKKEGFQPLRSKRAGFTQPFYNLNF